MISSSESSIGGDRRSGNYPNRRATIPAIGMGRRIDARDWPEPRNKGACAR